MSGGAARAERTNFLELAPERALALVAALGGAERHALALSRAIWRQPMSAERGLGELASSLAGFPRKLARALDERCGVDLPRVVRRRESAQDPGTVKLVLAGADGATFETVLFRGRKSETRFSLCVSTQAGCRMACPFCATGLGGLERNLTPAEIASQLLVARSHLPPGAAISNLVAMGMGEPLDNLDSVLDAVQMLAHPACGAMAADRIVLSTCGHVPGLRRLAAFPLAVGLAVSLHAADDGLRDRLVPLNRRWPLAELVRTLAAHPLRTGKWICFEYVLLKGVNDSDERAAALGPLLGGLRALVQVIPYNRVPGLLFEPPTDEETRRFAARVRAGGVPVAIRWSRGPDIEAACGQLRGAAS